MGMYLIPTFFKKAKDLMNDETLIVASIGLCLGMVVLATHMGFSAALGAFIMGSLIAEAPNAEHIEHLVKPVKDLFGAVFFVSVGMLVDPSLLISTFFSSVLFSHKFYRLFPPHSIQFSIDLPYFMEYTVTRYFI